MGTSDLTLKDLASQLARTLSSVDSKLLRSLRAIFAAPGSLTAAYVRGERRRFLGPLPLFFIANAVFFGMQSLTSTNVLSSGLNSHLNVQDWRDLAQSLVARRFGDDDQALAKFASQFDRAAIFNAKALIILMVVAFAPIPMVLFRGSHRALGAHAVFALHLYTFVLVVLCASLALAQMDLFLGGSGLAAPNVDTWLTLANLTVIAVYIYIAIGPVYSPAGAYRLVAATVLAMAVGALFVGYRFAIFLITFYTT